VCRRSWNHSTRDAWRNTRGWKRGKGRPLDRLGLVDLGSFPSGYGVTLAAVVTLKAGITRL